MWNIWQGAVPNDLDIPCSSMITVSHSPAIITAIKSNSTTLLRSIYDHYFAVLGPKLWKTIPKYIKCAPSFEVSKSKLTSHFMIIIPDLPPVPGYTTPNLNSILDWNVGGLQQVVELGIKQKLIKGTKGKVQKYPLWVGYIVNKYHKNRFPKKYIRHSPSHSIQIWD